MPVKELMRLIKTLALVLALVVIVVLLTNTTTKPTPRTSTTENSNSFSKKGMASEKTDPPHKVLPSRGLEAKSDNSVVEQMTALQNQSAPRGPQDARMQSQTLVMSLIPEISAKVASDCFQCYESDVAERTKCVDKKSATTDMNQNIDCANKVQLELIATKRAQLEAIDSQ